jgi:hypothetical protein
MGGALRVSVLGGRKFLDLVLPNTLNETIDQLSAGAGDFENFSRLDRFLEIHLV